MYNDLKDENIDINNNQATVAEVVFDYKNYNSCDYVLGNVKAKEGDLVLVERNYEYVTGTIDAIWEDHNDYASGLLPIITMISEDMSQSDIYKAIDDYNKTYDFSSSEKEFRSKFNISPFIVTKHRTYNRDELLKSNYCACYHCERIFKTDEIYEWLERDANQTAICPYCGETFVVGDASGLPIYDIEFVENLHDYWFNK